MSMFTEVRVEESEDHDTYAARAPAGKVVFATAAAARRYKLLVWVALGIVSLVLVLYLLFGVSGASVNTSATVMHFPYQQSYHQYNASSTVYNIAIVADKDTLSLAMSDTGVKYWTSVLMRGRLTRFSNPTRYTIAWDDPIELKLQINENGRGMELSELAYFNNRLLAFDDRTGIVFEVDADAQKAYPTYIMMEGNGRTTKGQKSEWATVRGDTLYVGSIGKEWTNPQGEIVNTNNLWVKSIDLNGHIESHNWKNVYTAMRAASGTSYPGYLIHEGACWNPVTRRWYFLPRRASSEPYDEKEDEMRGTDKLISFSSETDPERDITVQTIPDWDPKRGFSTIKFVPGRETEIVALKTEEFEGQTSSYITVFTLSGKILMKDSFIADVKFEGVEFL
eukprot:TRINITY_DN999_c0_g1_i1.p2 TRINITY_DN999_c0_g1~~TRINITY_DN999_c0_g1_i1.p2  ORF type:complete len:413 (-),score=118.17 TRINITY_DN999_c0_g1_i1:2320-3501(-)